eukprot:m.21359 g.21359  ORF g.21359 m.21359 type:complete len:257 (+) comp8276_c0_seq1:126-896(+)
MPINPQQTSSAASARAVQSTPDLINALDRALMEKPTKPAAASKASTSRMPLIRGQSGRKHQPQNSRVFKTQHLPQGGHISFYSVPGRDGDRAAAFFSDSEALDIQSTQRASYNSRTSPTSLGLSTTRYGCTTEPWALSTLGHRELGIVPEHYESKIQTHMDTLRRVRTAPESIGRPRPYRRGAGPDIDDDIASVTGDVMTADLVNSWLASASRLEQNVVQQMLRDVAARLRDTRDRPASRQVQRPASVQGTGTAWH